MRAAFDESATEAGVPEVLVTCAGIMGQRVPIVELDVDRLETVLAVHLKGTVVCAQAFARLTMEGPRSIVTIGSIVGLGGFTTQLDYGAAKAAIVNTTQVMSMEWAAQGIRVNCVAPGFIDTGMTHALAADGYDLGSVSGRVPMRRLGRPEEVADVVAFLALDATYVTGVVLPVDGGWAADGR